MSDPISSCVNSLRRYCENDQWVLNEDQARDYCDTYLNWWGPETDNDGAKVANKLVERFGRELVCSHIRRPRAKAKEVEWEPVVLGALILIGLYLFRKRIARMKLADL